MSVVVESLSPPSLPANINQGWRVKIYIREQQRGWMYYTRWHSDGKNHNESLETQDLAVALRRRAKREAENFPKAGSEGHGIEAFVSVYVDHLRRIDVTPRHLQNVGHVLLRFTHFIGGATSLSNITSSDVESYLEALRNDGLAKATVHLHYRSLRAMFAYAVRMETLSKSPFDKMDAPKLDKRLPRGLSLDEVQRLLKVIDRDDDYRLVMFLLLTGLRIREALALRWEGATDKRMIVFGKGSRERILPITDSLHKILGEPQNEWLFPGRAPCRGGKVFSVRGRIAYAVARVRLKGYMEKAGITGYGAFHRLRHTFGSLLGESGVSGRQIQALMGHSTSSASELYVILGEEKTRELAETFAKSLIASVETAPR